MNKISSKEIIDELDKLFPDAHCELIHSNAFELLIAVILSGQSTDERVNKCTPLLFNKFDCANKLANADVSEIENIIKPIGLFHHKAINIINTSKIIVDRYDGKVPNNRKDLESLPGVGRKTANVVLSNCFNFPAFAVDTHVSRVSKRLNIASFDDDVLTIENKLNYFFPKEKWCKLHHQFIFFGRYKCKAIKPLCDDCPFKGRCNHDL